MATLDQILRTIGNIKTRKAINALLSAVNLENENQEDGIAILSSALKGDIRLEITPETITREETAEAFARTVTLTLKNGAGDIHTWATILLSGVVAVSDDSALGTASSDGEDLQFINGVASVILNGDAAAWAEGETNTVTISDLTILGYTVSGGTSVETIVAAAGA